MPSLVRMHASGSQPPVTTAIRGISPSVRFLGSLNMPSGSAVSVHATISGTITVRRHLPVVMMIGTFIPGGTPSRWNLPSGSVVALVYAPPGRFVEHWPHWTPSGNGGGDEIGA